MYGCHSVCWCTVVSDAQKFIPKKMSALFSFLLFVFTFYRKTIHWTKVVNLITSSVVRDTTRSHWIGINGKIDKFKHYFFPVYFRLSDAPTNISIHLVPFIATSIDAIRKLCVGAFNGKLFVFFFLSFYVVSFKYYMFFFRSFIHPFSSLHSMR